MEYFLILLLIIFCLFLIARPLTVLFHELGHAIPAILLTKQKVTIYIGSYGDPNKSLKINLGLLLIFFRYNPFAWRSGLCAASSKTITTNKQIVYTITGPLASFIIGSIACYFSFAYDLHGFLKLFLIIFLVSAFLDLLANLIPNPRPIKLYDGSITYNDGYSLRRLFYYKRISKEYSKAVDFYNEQRYGDAAILSEKKLLVVQDINIYRLAISSYVQEKDYKKIKELSDSFPLKAEMNSDDLSIIAFSYSQLDLHDEALELYNKSLQQNPNNKYSLNNHGFTLNLINKFEEAIPLFDKAIEIDKTFAHAYNNRGLSKIKLGQVEEGLKDINYFFELDPNNSYGYRNLGIYHFDKGEFDEALRLFIKGKELDSATNMIDELINNTRHQIGLKESNK